MENRAWILPEPFFGVNLVELEWKEYQKNYEIAIQTEKAIKRLGREERPSNIILLSDILYIMHEGLIYEWVVLDFLFFGISKPLLSFTHEKKHLIILFPFKWKDTCISGRIYKNVDMNLNMESNQYEWINFERYI